MTAFCTLCVWIKTKINIIKTSDNSLGLLYNCLTSYLDTMLAERLDIFRVGSIAEKQMRQDLDGEVTVVLETQWAVAAFSLRQLCGVGLGAGQVGGDPQRAQTHKWHLIRQGTGHVTAWLTPLGISRSEPVKPICNTQQSRYSHITCHSIFIVIINLNKKQFIEVIEILKLVI